MLKNDGFCIATQLLEGALGGAVRELVKYDRAAQVRFYCDLC